MSKFVAASLDVPVGVDLPVVDDKRLVGNAFRLLDEPVQNRANAGGELGQLQLHSVADHLQQKEEVSPKVWEAQFLQNMSGDDGGDQS